MRVNVTLYWTNKNPMTIHNRLKDKLGREPTHDELKVEVRRIMEAALITTAERGKLPHQRRSLA